jgi:signal transduction histidine kinase
MEQHFHNLCLNALEAMSEGSELTVGIADPREAGGNYLLVGISDTGPRISADLVENIFNSFTSKSGCTFTVGFPGSDERPATIRT